MILINELLYYKSKLISLDLSFNSYLGLFLIMIGLIVRVDFKFSMQKDLQ